MRCIARGSLASPAKSGRDLYESLSLILGIRVQRAVHRDSGDRRRSTRGPGHRRYRRSANDPNRRSDLHPSPTLPPSGRVPPRSRFPGEYVQQAHNRSEFGVESFRRRSLKPSWSIASSAPGAADSRALIAAIRSREPDTPGIQIFRTLTSADEREAVDS